MASSDDFPPAANNPIVAMPLDQHQKLRDEAGTLYNSAKAYWPMIVMLASLSGLGGAQVPALVNGVSGKGTPTVQVAPTASEMPDLKKVTESIVSLRKDLDATVDVIADQKKIIDKLIADRAPKKTSSLNTERPPPANDPLLARLLDLRAKVAEAERAGGVAINRSHGLDLATALPVDIHRENEWLAGRLAALTTK